MGQYHYWDTPDYEDLPKKALVLAKGSLCLSLPYTFIETVSRLAPKTPYDVAWRFAQVNTTFVGANVAVTAAAYLISNLRGKKDDCWNYLIGGFFGGAVWAIRHRSPGCIIFYGFPMAFLSACLKKMSEERVTWSMTPNSIFGKDSNAFGYRRVDLTFGYSRPDPGRGGRF